MIAARIAAVRQGTPTVKVFTFDTAADPLHFKAGQWVDLYVEIDGEQQVGGYSMTSSPLTMGAVEFAIKHSEANPVTRYLHERAKAGDRVFLDGGQGECFYEAGMAQSLVLIAGGIGITPLMSIVRYALEATPDVPVTLLYGATSPEEHLFRDELEALAAQSDQLRCVFLATRDVGAAERPVLLGRVDRRLLERYDADPDSLHYVCGPPGMIDDVAAALIALDIEPSHIRFERWW